VWVGTQAQRSHWQTVLPLMVEAPLPLAVGDGIELSGTACFADDKPTTYTLRTDVLRN
jgi:hypothetical protein